MIKKTLRQTGITNLYYQKREALRVFKLTFWGKLFFNSRKRKYFKTQTIPRLHIGCGHNILHKWLNTDLVPVKKEVLPLNVKKLPIFNDNTFQYIFTEHMIEHIAYKDAKNMLKECYRILKPNGRIRIATPNLNFLIDLYNNEKTNIQKDYIKFVSDKDIGTNKYIDTFVINNFFYNYGHQFIYDFKTMKALLEEVGFVQVEMFEPHKSNTEELMLLEKHGTVIGEQFNLLESFVVEAVK